MQRSVPRHFEIAVATCVKVDAKATNRRIEDSAEAGNIHCFERFRWQRDQDFFGMTEPDGPLAVRPRTRALPRRQRLINRLGRDCRWLSLAWFLPAAIPHLDTGDGHRKLDDIVARVPFPHDSDVTATGALRRFEPNKLVRLSQWRPFPFQLDSALSPLSNPMWPLSAAPAQP